MIDKLQQPYPIDKQIHLPNGTVLKSELDRIKYVYKIARIDASDDELEEAEAKKIKMNYKNHAR